MTVTEELLVTPEVLECPYPYYQRVRDEAPVHQTPLGFWVVSRYDDVLAVVRDTERFSSGARPGVQPAVSPELLAIEADGYPNVDTLLSADPPVHTQFRALVNKAFTPKRVAQLEDSIRSIAIDLLERFIDDGRVELVTQFAVGVPLTVIADALGVDRTDMPDFKRWSDDAVAPLSGLLSPEQMLQTAHSRVEFQHYMAARCTERQTDPRDDLLSDLVQARFDSGDRAGEPLQMHELLSVIQQLLVAGNETTTKLIASGMQMLIEHPDQMEAVMADRSLIPNLVEESLRIETPVQMLPRVAKVDADVGGVTIPAGSLLFVLYGCANRDEAKYPDAAAFDVRRTNARTNLAFGQGPHFCPGAALARSEARIAFELLLSRCAGWAYDTAVDQPTHRELSMTLRGLSQLHLTFVATEGA
jgi:cytochrome P450